MKKISILLPSRGRIEQTKASVESLFTLADDPTRFEICARIDSDDVESIKLYEQLAIDHDNVKYVIKKRGKGYHILNVLYDEAMSMSDPEADYVYVWGNDNIMETRGWDTKLIACTVKNPAVVWPNKNGLYYCFPIVNKRWFTLFGNGKFPDCPFVDTFFYFTMMYAVKTTSRDTEELETLSGLDVRHNIVHDVIHNEAKKKEAPRPTRDAIVKNAIIDAAKLVKEW